MRLFGLLFLFIAYTSIAQDQTAAKWDFSCWVPEGTDVGVSGGEIFATYFGEDIDKLILEVGKFKSLESGKAKEFIEMMPAVAMPNDHGDEMIIQDLEGFTEKTVNGVKVLYRDFHDIHSMRVFAVKTGKTIYLGYIEINTKEYEAWWDKIIDSIRIS